MTQTEFKSTGRGTSQCDLILAVLKAKAGLWVPMPELSAAGSPGGFCMVHSRVADLRKRGYVIEHRNERADGTIKSFYKLQP